jgi:hypothetical protein
MSQTVRRNYLDYLFMLLIVIAGAAALLYKIGQVPPLYPWSDESEVAADAVASLNHGLQLIYPIQRTGGSMGVWVETGWMALFGRSLLGLRLLNGLINLGTALLLYVLVKELPLHPPGRDRRWPALAAGLLLAVSTWLLGLGRIATPHWSLVPPLTCLAFYWFWRGWQSRRWGFFGAAGAVIGLLFYGYFSGYFVIAVPAGFLILAWLFNLEQRTFLKPPVCLLIFPAALLVAGPVLSAFVRNPILVLNRPLQVVHNSGLSEGGSLLAGSLDMLSTFGLWPNWLLQGNYTNLAFDPPVTMLFVAGLLIALWHWRQPGYLFVLVWWAVMIMPAWLSRSASEGFIFEVWRRGIGAQPVSFILPALALVSAVSWLQTRWPAVKPQLILAPAIGLVVVVSAGFSTWFYFKQWARPETLAVLFAETPVRLAEWMAQTGQADTLYLLPMRANASYTTRPELFTVRYLYDGPAQIAVPVLDEAGIDRALTGLLADHHPRQIKLMLPNWLALDPKGYFDYALNTVGRRRSQEQNFGFTITTYQVDQPAALAAPLEPGDISFGDALQLVGQRLATGRPAAGHPLGVALRWAKTNDAPLDYSASLRLVDAQGYEIARVDQPLLSQGDYLTTRHWPPDAASTLYFSLPLPPETPPGRYSLRLVAYDTMSGDPLPAPNGQPDLSVRLVELDLQPNPLPVDPAGLAMVQPMDLRLATGLRLVGADNPASLSQRPGDRLRVTLLWQAAQPLNSDLGLILALVGPDHTPIPLWTESQPLIPGYATSLWAGGRLYRANYTVLLPATLPTGAYQLAFRLVDLETDAPLTEQLLGVISVQARDPIFEAPPLAAPVDAAFTTPAGDEAIRLLSYEILSKPDRSLDIKLQWQASRALSSSYKLFIHLTDATGHMVSQVDILPQQGAALTTSWLPGEIIEDAVRLSPPAAGSAGPYRLLVGWYDQVSGERLLTGQGDVITLFNGK